MAREERKKEDLYIKSKRKATNFFVTSSTAMTGNRTTKTTTIAICQNPILISILYTIF